MAVGEGISTVLRYNLHLRTLNPKLWILFLRFFTRGGDNKNFKSEVLFMIKPCFKIIETFSVPPRHGRGKRYCQLIWPTTRD
ncbi:MAG: hypothetical protein LBR79_05155 [Oscillospiraceae bacterium]|nr:hypothetical protein [Oscillospiraceae bacterium]